MKKKWYLISNIVIIIMLVTLGAVSFSSGGFYAVSLIENNKPIYKGNAEKQQVSLMINVYWGGEFIDGMLTELKKYNAKCTFFFGGSWVDDNNDMINKIKNDGHEIANHGYFHKDHKKLSYEKNKEEILTSESVIESICGVKTKLFAPPSGAFSDNTLKVCEELGYKVIMWSKDTIDWRDKNADLIFKRATNNLENGDLILMHPTASTLEALPRILKLYKDKDFSAVTVSQNIAKDLI